MTVPPSASRAAPYRVRLSGRALPGGVSPAPVTPAGQRWPGFHPGATHAGHGPPYTRPMAVQMAPSILAADFARLAGRGRGGRRRGRLAARGRHGRPLRAQPHHRPAGGGVAAQARRPAAGLPPDDQDPDRWAPGLRRGRGAERHHPRRGRPAPVRHAADDPRGRRPGRAGAQPGHPGRAVRRPAARDRHAAADDGGAGVRRPALPGPGAAEAAPGPCAGRPATAARCGCRWTAG